MGKKPLCVAILWHMHQPDYGNVQTGEIYLPWTRFHAVKDYRDMAAIAASVPGMRLTINVVPSLVDQLEAYGSGRAKETYAELTLKNAAQLSETDRQFLLRTFFQLPWGQMLDPYPRYRELLERRGPADSRGEYPDGLKRYSVRDYRDLQMWFNLAWCGLELRSQPEIAALFRKGKGFTEEDKRTLLDAQVEFIASILPYYSRLQDESRIELSVSPYYHPILPLLCDTRSAREALPSLQLPHRTFSWPADAREQILRARRKYHDVTGRDPLGMWPSEGSISDAALGLAREAGFRWLATDEGVLANSARKCGIVHDGVPAAKRYSVWRWGDGTAGPCLFFRDHGLSDLIGFQYSKWRAADAADDFVKKLREIHDGLPDDGRFYVVPVILDGENAWEHYPDNGVEFLTFLYSRIADSNRFRPVTCSEFLDIEPHREVLPSVLAGSWIYSSFSTWVGHPEKNRAWELLCSARSFLKEARDAGADPRKLQAAFDEIMIAEGSDWFWWYGDDHQTQNAAEFDALFRSHVKNVYHLLGRPCPADTEVPIKRANGKTRLRVPIHTISPTIDGKVTDYFEWLSAGSAKPAAGESMHRSRQYLDRVYFGYDQSAFYLRIDPATRKWTALPPGATVRIQFAAPKASQLSLARDAEGRWNCTLLEGEAPSPPLQFAGGSVLELAVPFSFIGIDVTGQVDFAVTVLEEGGELERLPAIGFLSVRLDPAGLDEQEWMV